MKKNKKNLGYDYFPEDPDGGIFWYLIVTSRFLYKVKLFVCLILILLVLFLFFIYRFVWEHESLVLFICIHLYCFLLFYVFCW